MSFSHGLLRALFLIVFFSNVCLSATIHVPANQPTIQAGIDAANGGDTVLVSDGTYTGDGNRDISTRGKAIVVKSENGPASTVISCGGTPEEKHIAFLIDAGEDSTTIIEGFGITGALGDTVSYYIYGAVSCSTSSPTFRNCMIKDNSGPGVLSLNWSRPLFEDCSISDNSGHGVLLKSGHIELMRCEIARNDSDGVNLDFAGVLRMDSCLVFANGGNGVFAATFYDDLFLYNNTFYGNNRGFKWYFNFPKSGNKDNPDRYNELEIRGNIFAYNQTTGFEADFWGEREDIILCNNAYGNVVWDWPTNDPDYNEEDFGNISADPLFCNASSADFRILAGSPCLPANNDCSILIGAQGGCFVGLCGDLNSDSVVNILDILFYLDWKFGAGSPPVELSMADVNSDTEYNVLDILYLIEFKFNEGPAPDCP